MKEMLKIFVWKKLKIFVDSEAKPVSSVVDEITDDYLVLRNCIEGKRTNLAIHDIKGFQEEGKN